MAAEIAAEMAKITVVKSLFHQNMERVCTTIEHKINLSSATD